MATIYDPSAKPDLVTVDSPYEESKIYKNTENVTLKLAESGNTKHVYGTANVPAKIYHTPDSGLTIAIIDDSAHMTINEDIASDTTIVFLLSGSGLGFNVALGQLLVLAPTKTFIFNGLTVSIGRFQTAVTANTELTIYPTLIGVK